VRVHRTGRVEIVVPPRTPARSVERFVADHRPWIDERVAHALRHAPPSEPFPPAHVSMSALGERWRVHLAGGAGRRRAETIAPGLLAIAGREGGIAQALRRWLVAHAREPLQRFLEEGAQATGLGFGRMQVRRQRTRWGSCSRRGTVSVNACLVFQPPEVVRYLMVHELAHTRYMDHSPRFWRLVETHCPDWRSLDRELLAGWRHVPRWVFEDPS
jgi:hypothetical protein